MNNSVDSEYTIDNSFGTFGVVLESVQRLPWTTEDLLVAKIRIRNARDAAVILPAFTGGIKAGQTALDPSVQVVAAGSSQQLAAGASAVYYVIGKLPYEQSLDQIKIGLNSGADDTAEAFLSLNTRQVAPASLRQPTVQQRSTSKPQANGRRSKNAGRSYITGRARILCIRSLR